MTPVVGDGGDYYGNPASWAAMRVRRETLARERAAKWEAMKLATRARHSPKETP